MKHVKLFEDFVNEAQIKFKPKGFNQVKPGNTAHVYGDDNAWEVIATGYGKDFDSKLSKYDKSGAAEELKDDPNFDDIFFIAVKHGSETAVYVYGSDGAWVNMNEAIDVKYWTDYNTDTSGQSDPEFAIKSKDFEATFKEAVKDWNDRGDDPITMGEAEKVKKIAKEFFNRAGWISVNVAQAMIAQES